MSKGVVAAETLLSIVNEKPIHSQENSTANSTASISDPSLLMFPYIQGILAFDTPYLGIAPGVVAHGAEKHWNTANTAYSAYTNLVGAFWGKNAESSTVDPSKMLPAPETTVKAVRDSNADAAAAPLWQRYGRVALFAGAAGAVAAGGAAAYMKREQISEGWSWATSHLEFVGSLARPEDLRKRLTGVAKLAETQHIGFTNIYTTLGHAVQNEGKASYTGQVLGKDRTFCNLPKGEMRRFFVPSVNDRSTAETLAHMTMFEPRNNPGYYGMSEHAKGMITRWVQNEWYAESEGPMKALAWDEEGELIDKPVNDEDDEEMAWSKDEV